MLRNTYLDPHFHLNSADCICFHCVLFDLMACPKLYIYMFNTYDIVFSMCKNRIS